MHRSSSRFRFSTACNRHDGYRMHCFTAKVRITVGIFRENGGGAWQGVGGEGCERSSKAGDLSCQQDPVDIFPRPCETLRIMQPLRNMRGNSGVMCEDGIRCEDGDVTQSSDRLPSLGEHQQGGSATCCEFHPNGSMQYTICSRATSTARGRSGAAMAAALVFIVALIFVARDALVQQTTWSGRDAMLQEEGSLMGSALKDVQQLYKSDPKMVEEWAMLTGKKGKALLHLLQGKTTHHGRPALKTQRGGSKLNQYLHELKLASREEAADKDVSEVVERMQGLGVGQKMEKGTAWMLVNDLSDEWDHNANYTTTPWEFCKRRKGCGGQE
eukprot:541710-Hanusia_phi.AAC.3